MLCGRSLGKYEILARIATGGMASIYVARSIGVAGFERLFAIKVLHSHLAHEREFIAMFLDEAKLAARIRHSNVLSAIDVCDTVDTGYYLVMDYVEGDHLGALLSAANQKDTRLPVNEALRIFLDALTGLAAAHELSDETGHRLNLVHRDVSPQNILVGTDGVSRLTDFGVAKAESCMSTTRSGEVKGKIAYMAPECAFEGPVDQRSDLFAMGVVLWECVTGRRLFRAENQAATLNMICNEPIAAPSTVDPQLAPLDPVLEKALSRDPNLRFQTAVAFMDAIENVGARVGGLASRRSVSNSVKELVKEKLERDRKLIRNAVVTSGVSPRTDTPSLSMGERISHIRIKNSGEDDPAEARDSDSEPEAVIEESPQESKSETPSKISGVRKRSVLQRLRVKWLLGGVAGGATITIALAALYSFLSTPASIDTRSLELAKIKPMLSYRPRRDFQKLSTKQPTVERAASDTSEKGSATDANRSYPRTSSRKDRSSEVVLSAQKGDTSASSDQRHQQVQKKPSFDSAETEIIPANPFYRSSKQELNPRPLSTARSSNDSSATIPDNPFEPSGETPKRRKSRLPSQTATAGSIPDNPFD